MSSDIVGRPALVHLRRRAHDEHGQPGQGPRLVRQRVGLLEPPRRPDGVSPAPRCQALSADMSEIRVPDARRTSATSAASGSSSAPTSTCRSTTARSPTTSASAPRCRPSSGCTERGATVVTRAATSAARRARRTRSTRWSRCGPAWPSWRRASSCSRTCASTRVRRQRPGVRRDARRGHRRLRQRRLRCVAPGPCLDRRAAAVRCRRRWGACSQKEVEVLLGLRDDPKRPFVAVLGGAKVCDKLGVIEALLEVVDALVIGGGDVLHVPRRAGQPDRRLAVRARPGRHVPAPARRRRRDGQDHPPARGHHRRRRRRRGPPRSAPACPTARRASTSAPARRPRSPT